MYIIWIMAAFLLLCVIRLIMGPSVWDRLLGLNVVSAKIIIIIMLAASVFDLTYLLDFAIIYALMGFIGTIFTAHFIMERIKTLQRAEKESKDGNIE